MLLKKLISERFCSNEFQPLKSATQRKFNTCSTVWYKKILPHQPDLNHLNNYLQSFSSLAHLPIFENTKQNFMEREVILTTQNKYFRNRKVDAEIENIKKMLPYIESFDSFCANNEVFDMNRQTSIKRKSKLRNVFEQGANSNAEIFIYGKN